MEEAEARAEPAPVVLSEGAGIALGSVFARLIKPRASERALTLGKRPRSEKAPVMFIESEEVQESLAEEKEERRKFKEAKKAKQKFESNGLVIPDAATGAPLEKDLLKTATKGAVALFNAVSKAHKIAEEKPAGKKKKKGPPISRENFMDIMKAGVNKESAPKPQGVQQGNDSSDEEVKPVKSGAKWLQDDYLTAGSKKLRDWEKDASENAMESSSDENETDSGDESSDS